MKLFTILAFICIITQVCPSEGVTWNNDEMPVLYEGSQYSAVCVDDSPATEIFLLKDGTLIKVFNESDQQLEYKRESIDISAFAAFSNENFLVIVTWKNLTKESNGVYTCQVNESYFAYFALEVSERKAICQTTVKYRQEYFAGEELQLNCYNPFEDSGLTAGWYLENGTKLQETETGVNPPSSTSSITLEEKYNSTSYDCQFLTENNTFSEEPFHSCSVGPILVYNSSFIRMESFNGSYFGSTGSVTFNCRIVPQRAEVTYKWLFDPMVASFEISTTEVESNLTLTDFLLDSNDALEIDITCEGMSSGMNFSTEYNFYVYNENLERRNTFFVIIIVISSVLTTVVIIFLIVLCFYLMVQRCRRTTLGISEERVSKNNEVITAHAVVLNKYDRGPDHETKYDYSDENQRNSVLSRLPDGRFHLQERRPSTMSNVSNVSSFSNTSEHSVQGTGDDEDIYDDPPMRTLIPLKVIATNAQPSSNSAQITRPSFLPPLPPAEYDTTIESPTTPTGTDFTKELKNRLSCSEEPRTGSEAMIYDDPPSEHLYYSDDETPVYASPKKETSFYNETEDTEYWSGVNEGYESEDDYTGITEND